MYKKPKRMLFIYNTNAGQGLVRQNLPMILDLFTKGGYLVTCYPTQERGDTTDMIRLNASRFDLVTVAGGDGTLHEAINGMLAVPVEDRTPLGYIPAGSTNDFAASHDLSKNMQESVKQIIEGQAVPYDIGRFDIIHSAEDAWNLQSGTEIGRKVPDIQYFSYVAAFGTFTDVSYDTPQDLKNRIGYAAYLLNGMGRLSEYRPHHLKVEADGELIEGDFQVGLILNTRQVGGFQLRMKDISLHDGLAEMILIKTSNTPFDMMALASTVMTQDLTSDLVISRKVHRITIQTVEPLAWTLDGEYGGATNTVAIKTERNALNFMVDLKSDGR